MKVEIDNLINTICQNVVGGELTQLGALFTPYFLDELSKIVYSNECQQHPELVINVETELCWIDKAPYAQLCNKVPFDRKVELGDAMFIFDEKFVNSHTHNVVNEKMKAFILQAKVTEKETHICEVPVTKYDPVKKNSTYKEFELYNQWLAFNISYSSNTNQVEEQNVDLMKMSNSDTCRFAWYGVAASTRHSGSQSVWDCRWMVGKAVMNDPCDKTLGQLLSSFYQDTLINGSHVGEYFKPDNLSNPAWERVVHHVLTRCQQLGKPSYFPMNVSTQNRIISSQMQFLASHLMPLFVSYGLNGQCFLSEIIHFIADNPNAPLDEILFFELGGLVSKKDILYIYEFVMKITSFNTRIVKSVRGVYKPRKFPVLRVTVKRQEIERVNVPDMR